mmetsp:Transcript_81218/g.143657  ORF Transcript_81218/g.143657 Transcript_81218/m.143657 type:complete len:622 (+) Transcript_81218:49-1914(+)
MGASMGTCTSQDKCCNAAPQSCSDAVDFVPCTIAPAWEYGDMNGEDLEVQTLSCEEVLLRLEIIARAEEAQDVRLASAYASSLRRVLTLMVTTLSSVPGSAALVLVAPDRDISVLEYEMSDSGEKTQELVGVTVHDKRFEKSLSELAWCYSGDVDPRGRPIDSGFVVSHCTGKVVAAGVCFVQKPTGIMPRFPGTEYMSAVDLAASLNRGVVFTRTKQGVVSAFAAAEVQYGRCLQVLTPKHEGEKKGDNIELAVMLDNLGIGHLQRGNAGAAKQLHERALRIQEAHYGPNHVQVAVTLDNLGIANTELGHPEVAKDLLERALRIHEAHFGAQHVQVAWTLDNLGCTLRDLGQLQQARVLHERALRIYQMHYGSDHNQLGRTLNNLGHTYRGLGNPAAAKPLYQRALNIFEKEIEPDQAQVAVTLNNLGNSFRELGDVPNARSLYERALTIAEVHFGASHVEVGRTLNNLGLALQELGDPVAARPLFERALDIFEVHFGAQSPLTAMAQTNLATCLATQGAHQEALKCVTQAEATAQADSGIMCQELFLRAAAVRFASGDTSRPTPQERWHRAEDRLQSILGASAMDEICARCKEGLLRTWYRINRPDVMQWLQSRGTARL